MSKERPILMCAPMIRSLLARLKRNTRRIVKVSPSSVYDGVVTAAVPQDAWKVGLHCFHEPDAAEAQYLCCPYGEVGDTLWVRETFRRQRDCPTMYRATTPMNDSAWTWKPSIFMPRALSRITLEIESVRVERLQDISEEDAKAEGIRKLPGGGYGTDAPFSAEDSAVEAYRVLWESINGPKSWKRNDWLWVIGFAPATSPAPAPEMP